MKVIAQWESSVLFIWGSYEEIARMSQLFILFNHMNKWLTNVVTETLEKLSVSSKVFSEIPLRGFTAKLKHHMLHQSRGENEHLCNSVMGFLPLSEAGAEILLWQRLIHKDSSLGKQGGCSSGRLISFYLVILRYINVSRFWYLNNILLFE